jgi:hypothetical protein
MNKIIDTILSHPVYAALGIATALYLLWAVFKRVLKIILIAALLFGGYVAWMYFH